MKRIILFFSLALPLLSFGQAREPLTLEQAVSTALNNNYGIRIGQKNVEISQARNAWGAVGALPSLSLNGNAAGSWNNNDTDDYTSENYSGTVSLNWILFRGFGAFVDKAKLEEIEKLSEGNLALMVENTISSVILSYYNVLLQEENMKMAEKLMSLSGDRYESEKLKKEMGSSVTYTLLQAQNSYLEDQSGYLAARASCSNAVRQLNYLMAEPLDKQYQFLTTFQAETAEFDKTDLLDQMKSNNNTLINQYINLELARLDVKSAQSSFWPTLTANASTGYSDSETIYDTNSLMNRASSGTNTSVSLGLSFSLFDGGNKRRALKTAKLQEDIAAVEIDEMTADLENQLFQEYELYRVRIEMLNLADENLEAAELNLQISREKFESGAINSFNYRDVQQIYASVALNQHNAVFNVIQSYHTLLRLTGGLIEAYQ